MTENDYESDRKAYFDTWVKALEEFLGWPKDKTKDLIQRWSIKKDSMFFHERALWYIVPLLVSDQVKETVRARGDFLHRLYGRIQHTIEYGEGLDEMSSERLARMAPEDALTVMDREAERGYERGERLLEGRLEKYD